MNNNNLLTLSNLMKLLKAGTEAQELELIQTAKEIIDSEGSQESTNAVILSTYSGKLLPLDLIKTNDNKKYIAFTDNPALNPCEEDFDSVKYKKVLTEIKGDILEAGELIEEHQKSQERREAAKSLNNGELVKNLQSIGDYIKENLQGIDWALLPYILDELDKPETMASFDLEAPLATLPNSPEWLELIERAKAEKAKAKFKEVLTIDGDKVEKIHVSTDKVNREFWENATQENNNQMTINTQLTQQVGAIVTTTVNFDQLPEYVKKSLNSYDKRVFQAVVSLINIHCRCVQPEHILYAMGYNTNINPNQRQLEELHKSITKMRKIDVKIDNYEAAKITNYPYFYRGVHRLLNVDYGEAYSTTSGKMIKRAYFLPPEEPDLMQFARVIKQVTTFPRDILETPLNKTPKNMALEDYLSEQINWMKNEKSERSNSIKIDTVCKALKITDRKEKARTKDKIKIILDFYTKQEAWHFIKSFEESPEGFTITY